MAILITFSRPQRFLSVLKLCAHPDFIALQRERAAAVSDPPKPRNSLLILLGGEIEAQFALVHNGKPDRPAYLAVIRMLENLAKPALNCHPVQPETDD